MVGGLKDTLSIISVGATQPVTDAKASCMRIRGIGSKDGIMNLETSLKGGGQPD